MKPSYRTCCAVLICSVLHVTGAATLAGAPRPTPPTRDPQTPGYVAARELPDGAVPRRMPMATSSSGRLTQRAPEMTAQEGVPQGTVYHAHHELGGQQNISRHRAGAEHVWHGGSHRPGQAGGAHEPPGSLHPPGRGLCPQAIRSRHGRAFHCRGGRARPALFTALDNLIAQHRVPVMIAISIGNGGGDAQGSERGLEYDTMSGRYAEFVEKEVLPLVEKQCAGETDQGPRGPRDHGRQFRRFVRTDHGVVSSRPLSPRSFLFGDVCEPAVALSSGDPARRVGVS